MFKRITFILVAVGAVLFLPEGANAEKLALVIGNANYDNVADLGNTRADAQAYSDAFETLGYDVIHKSDLDWSASWDALDVLITKIQPGDDVVFVYAGHGWSDGKVNYLLPIDTPKQGSERQLIRSSIALRDGNGGVLDEIERAGARLTVAIIDACRDNPLQSKGDTRSAGMTRGLSHMSVQDGTFVVFSAGAGEKALDNLPDDPPEQKLSVFTRSFVPLLMGNVYLEDAISEAQVRTAMLAASHRGHRQRPAYYDETLGKTCLTDSCGAFAMVDSGATVAIDVETEPEQPADASAAAMPTKNLDAPAKQAENAAQPSDNQSLPELTFAPQTVMLSKPDDATPSPAAVAKPSGESLATRMDQSASVSLCDELGQNPAHPDLEGSGKGAKWDDLNGRLAERACMAALEEFPDQPRLLAALGRAYEKQESELLALRAYLRASDLGDPVAQNNLGMMYDGGRGVSENNTKAFERYEQAALQGYAPAQANLGYMYETGEGVRRDMKLAVSWYRKGAASGNANSQNNLGVAYEKGTGVQKDTLEAARLYALAKAQGDSVAADNLNALARHRPAAKDIQSGLKVKGYYTGAIDGAFGRKSWAALEDYCGCGG